MLMPRLIPLYDDGKLKITYRHSPNPGEEDKIVSMDDHELWVGEDLRYILQRGILSEFAQEDKEKLPERLERLCPTIGIALKEKGLDYKDAVIAIAQARVKELEQG